jgi:hypothetical protein
MNGQVLSVAWYRFRATFGRRRGDYLAIILLVGLVGGLAMGALSAARRTQSSFATYLASTNPSSLSATVIGGGQRGQSGAGGVNYSASATRAIAHLPGVKHVESAMILDLVPLRRDGSPRLDTATLESTFTIASVDGLFFNQDRLAVIEGRMANPARPDEVVMTAAAVHVLGFHLGQVIPYGLYTQSQENLPDFGTPRVAPHRRIDAKLVGIVQVNNAVVQDDIDKLPTFIFFTPALSRQVLADSARGAGGVIYYGLQLKGGNGVFASAEREFLHHLPPGANYELHATAPIEAKVDRTVKPLAIALGVFGIIAALAALIIGLQVISRQLRADGEDQNILRSIGAGPSAIVAGSLIGTLGAIVAGSVLAVAVAVALSPLSPLGPVRPVYPGSGIAFDWTVLGFGVLVLVGGLGAMAVALAYRGAPHLVARRSGLRPTSRSRVAGAVASTGLPPAAGVGVRFALEAGRGRNAVPTRSALLGAALAVGLVVATFTFGSGLQTLVSHPALYGWNWAYMLNPSNNVPPQALALLNHDRSVAAWTGYNYQIVEMDGQSIPFLFEGAGGHEATPISPPILSGHEVEQKDQIVLGASTLAQLHKRLGETVTVTYGNPKNAPAYVPPTHLLIVGTATFPAVGYSSVIADHTSMGTGALVSQDFLPESFQKAVADPVPTFRGPELVFVRMRDGASASAGLASLRHIATVADHAFAAVPNGGGQGNNVTVLGVQHPAEIVNYRTMGITPALLAAGLAAGAILALGVTLTASVRRRRHDLALLKTLGFTQRQLASVLAWQASVAALIGIVVGVPLGITLGRWFWILFAHEIYAVPKPTVPVLSVVFVALGALVLANIVAALPGRIAARTSTAVLLRAE